MIRILLLLACFFNFGCRKKDDPKTITVAASSVPHAQILYHVKPELEKQGYTLKILEIDDYNVPNRALNEREVDANYFQHIPFMDEQIKEFGYEIKCYARIHLEPMAFYSTKIKNLSELPNGGKIAVPNDPTNEYRALKILEDKGIIQLRSGAYLKATIGDIASNPKQLRFSEIDAAMLPRTLKDVDAAAIPTNYALQAKLNPEKDALAIESKDSPYANIIAIHIGDGDKPKLVALKKVMLSPEMRTYINDTFHGAIIPILKECSTP